MAVHPLRPATDRRLGGPLPHQLANQTRVHLVPINLFTRNHAILCAYAVLAVISNCCPPVQGRLPTRYSPVRHSLSPPKRIQLVRLACVRHAASVHPEPGSNSHVLICLQATRLASCVSWICIRSFDRCLSTCGPIYKVCSSFFRKTILRPFRTVVWNFSGMEYTVKFSKIGFCCGSVLALFRLRRRISDSFVNLPPFERLVNNIF